MSAPKTLNQYLDDWVNTDIQRAIADTVCSLTDAGQVISNLIRKGPLAGSMGEVVGSHADGDTQKELDRVSNDMVIEALNNAPVAFIGSEELDDVIPTKNVDAPLCVAVDPLDGSSNIDTNVSVGTIFSILPRLTDAASDAKPEVHFFQQGNKQLAAGYIVYGPQTSLVLTLGHGQGTHIFTLDPEDGAFKLTTENVQIPEFAKEFAINASNYRYWDEQPRAYIDDCLNGEEGPRGKNFNMRWIASMVADCHRILRRGGIYFYPGDKRKGYAHGRLRLIYEGNPIGLLVIEAGGKATNGHEPVLDITPTDIHQRVPLVFGSANEVDVIQSYYDSDAPAGSRSPLFKRRGLFQD